nr:mitotic-spindle organizing protein 2B-like [Leptinotarsa decemlineata]
MASQRIENLTSLRPHQAELQQLGELAGVFMDGSVFRLLIELLNMGIDPDTIFNLLKDIKRSRNIKSRSSVVPSQKSIRSKVNIRQE